MTVTKRASEIFISGSLPKYLNGSNAFTLTRAGTKEVIYKMSDALSLPLGDSRVYRLDVGANIMVDYPVGDYLSTLGSWKQSYRKEFSNGNLSYQGGRASLNFYDKVLDFNRLGYPIPDHWINQNVLRVELQMKKAVKDQMGLAVHGRHLWEEAVYMKAIQKFKNAYLTVEKLKLMEEMPMVNGKEFRAYIEYLGIQALGYENALWKINMARSLGQITKDQAKDRKKVLKKMATIPNGEAKGLIQELDRKIEAVTACYR